MKNAKTLKDRKNVHDQNALHVAPCSSSQFKTASANAPHIQDEIQGAYEKCNKSQQLWVGFSNKQKCATTDRRCWLTN